jgi:hypothetical protein
MTKAGGHPGMMNREPVSHVGLLAGGSFRDRGPLLC